MELGTECEIELKWKPIPSQELIIWAISKRAERVLMGLSTSEILFVVTKKKNNHHT